MNFLRRFMPRTLLVRTFVLIAVLLLLSVLAWYHIFINFEREPRARQTAQMLSSVANLTRTALVSAHPNSRRYLMKELSDREGIHIYPAEDTDIVRPEEMPPFLQMTQEIVRKELGPQTRLALELNGERALFVTFHIAEDDYWVALPIERLERQLPQQWLGWGAAATLLALLGAWFVMFHVTRPLKALSQAAHELGQGRNPGTLDEAGPSELSALATAFNQMNADLARIDSNRAL